MFVLKKLSAELASPTNSDLELLRHVGKYLQGTPEIALVHKRSYPGKCCRSRSVEATKDEGETCTLNSRVWKFVQIQIGLLTGSQDNMYHVVLSC